MEILSCMGLNSEENGCEMSISKDSLKKSNIHFNIVEVHTSNTDQSIIKESSTNSAQNKDSIISEPVNSLGSNNIVTDTLDKIPESLQNRVASKHLQLKEDHICLLKKFTEDTSVIDDRCFLKAIHHSKFPRVKYLSLQKQLFKWKKLLCHEYINGKSCLVFKSSGKIILPIEKYNEAIINAHLGEGEFKNNHKKHHSYLETVKQVVCFSFVLLRFHLILFFYFYT